MTHYGLSLIFFSKPTGKLTKRNIQTGYQVLNEIQAVLDSSDSNKEAKLLDLTNKFFTIIPQDFGEERPQPIGSPLSVSFHLPRSLMEFLSDNLETLKKKIDMLEALQDIEIATSLLQGESTSGSALDESYKKLNTQFTPLDRNSEQYKVLKGYCERGHDTKYFRNFHVEVEDIFAVKRNGADELFAPWKDNENRQLLWHVRIRIFSRNHSDDLTSELAYIHTKIGISSDQLCGHLVPRPAHRSA